jgi:hypothetical protein
VLVGNWQAVGSVYVCGNAIGSKLNLYALHLYASAKLIGGDYIATRSNIELCVVCHVV